MTKKNFNIQDWLPAETKANESKGAKSCVLSDTLHDAMQTAALNDTETIIQRIESKNLDLTSTYSEWRDIGFAFAQEFGESGRDYFQRVSKFHAEYNATECDKQFDKCLKAKGHGISIESFYYKAKQAGVNIATLSRSKVSSQKQRVDSSSVKDTAEDVTFNTPQVPKEAYEHLPPLLKNCTNMFAERIEKDVFLIGALGVLSACLPNVQGVYFDEPVSAHLYAFITAPAGSGKGKLKWAKHLGLAIHKEFVRISLIEKEKYEADMDEYNNLNKNQRKDVPKPKEPKNKMFFIPGNSSSSAFIQALSDNNFKGILFETEADTLANTLKQEWGNFSDVLRKAFHHESTNMFRRKDNEHIEVEDPHLAITLSGTPKQVQNMMPDVENGLFSRFLYYAFEDYSDFKNPFISHSAINYIDFFNEQGQIIFSLYQLLDKLQKPIVFTLTKAQGEDFTKRFNDVFKRNRTLLGNDFNANSRRLGLITFRIAMILSALRILDTGDISEQIICTEEDYHTAIAVAFTLEKHAVEVFRNLPNNELQGKKLKFFEQLPKQFNRQAYLKVASTMEIKEKAAEKYIKQFRELKMLKHEHNSYEKIKGSK